MGEVLVVDASAMVDLLLRSPLSDGLLDLLRGSSALAAPGHLDAEVVSAVARLQRQGEITADDANDAIDELLGAPVTRVALAGLVAPAWELRGAVAVPATFYVALAMRFEAPLVTTDARLAHACAAEALCQVLVPSARGRSDGRP
jgi:predicted nucleic acid-binding protein